MFGKIKKYYQNKTIKDCLKIKHSKNLITIADAKLIGLIFEINDNNSENEIIEIEKNLWENKIDNKFLILIPKNIHQPETFSNEDFIKYYLKNNNWFDKPKIELLENFVNQEFDILIDFSNKHNFTKNYIITKSKAKLKIGKDEKSNENYFDIIISLKDEETNLDFWNYIEHYLKQLKGDKQ